MTPEVLTNAAAGSLPAHGDHLRKRRHRLEYHPYTFAIRFFRQAPEARRAGKFKDGIRPIKAERVEPETEEKEVLVASDHGMRDGVMPESSAKLKPAFKRDGSTHADGTAAVLLTKRFTTKYLGLALLGKFSTCVNINRGVIAIGQPLRCTGARQVTTELSIAKQTGGLVVVTGMGWAWLLRLLLTAIPQIANEVKAGQIEIDIGAGIESMTNSYGSGAMASVSDEQAGKFQDEIVPIKARWVNPKTEEERKVLVEIKDKLVPVLKQDGGTHAGSVPQVSDGTAAILLTKRSTAKRLSLPILGKFVTSAVVGVPSKIMDVGPAYAIPKALGLLRLSLEDFDFYAGQALMSVQPLGIGEKPSFSRVNINGDAIAIDHSPGCTVAHQVATGLSIAKLTGGRVLVTSIRFGNGMGMAAVFFSEH
ncbi:hypothetical protein EST38_g13514 [Candolleomyces aberdarensis]|uniref:Uncharacterized protein n=1 Tax=Candolleomyces aberdarensis TaxID=2316362 RepID=A0A4Q2CZL6_9AGAR|nr:hypothetical protein EST38_g13514 [Candolleomyces aberdarensis]